MKRFYLALLWGFYGLQIFAQSGVQFDPSIDISFDSTDVEVIQMPESPIKTQVLFVGGEDEASSLNYLNKVVTSVTKEGNDFVGITPDGNDGYYITVNQEEKSFNYELGDGGGMTLFHVIRDTENDTLIIEKTTLADGRSGDFINVDFINTVGETWNNCGGIINGSDGKIWTSEEYPPASNSAYQRSWNGDTLDFMIGYGTLKEDAHAGKYFNIDFANTVGETWNNCGGIINNYNRIWTAEEYPTTSNEAYYSRWFGDTSDFMIGYGYPDSIQYKHSPKVTPLFEGEVLQRYENIGWMVEIDPSTGNALRKQYNWGRMSFEGGAILDNQVVFLTEDGTPGLFTKFVADVPGDFTSGTLYAFNQLGDGANGHWIKMDNGNLTEMLHLADSAYKRGATAFIRLEWIVELDGKIYISETGLDNPSGLTNALSKGGNIAQHHYTRAVAQDGKILENDFNYHDYYGRVLVYDPSTDQVSVFLEGGPYFDSPTSQSITEYPEKQLSNPDGLGKLIVGDKMYLVIQEDLNGASYNRVPAEATSKICEMYLLDVSIENPTIEDLVRIYAGPHGAELTGGNGTPDGKSILVNTQHPSGNLFPFTSQNGVTVALTGFDKLENIEDAEILTDFENTAWPQYSVDNLTHQILFIGGTHKVTCLDNDSIPTTTVSKENNDFIGISPDGDDFWISVNLERQEFNELLGGGGGMATFKVIRDAATDTLQVVETTMPDGRSGLYHNVEFKRTVGETWNNCGGIINSDGRIWTAEEYPANSLSSISSAFGGDLRSVKIGEGLIWSTLSSDESIFKGESIKRYLNTGWMVEVDPFTKKAVRKQYNWGRMSFEGGATLNDSIVILSEDGTPGLLTKFVADKAGDFTSGKLFAYDQYGEGADGNWIIMDNNNLDEMLNLADSAYKKGATAFVRLEWVVEINGKFYISETGLDNPSGLINAIEKGGNIAEHHYKKAEDQEGEISSENFNYHDYYGRILVYNPETDSVSIFLEGGPEYANQNSQSVSEYPKKHLSNPDNLGKIYIGDKAYLLIGEDLNGSSYNRVPDEAESKICEMYLLDVSIENPTIDDLVRIYVGPHGAELTGGNGTPDGKSILVDIQHPSSSVYPYTSQNGVTTSMTGFDKLESIWDADINTDFIHTQTPQYSTNLTHQVLFAGGTDRVVALNPNGKRNIAISKENNDFIGITTIPESNDYWITVNAEMQSGDKILGNGGGMTAFRVKRNADDSFSVVSDTAENSFDHQVFPVVTPNFEGEIIDRYQNVGWMVEVDPVTGKALRKQYNWGRMSFEGGAILNDSIVFLSEDGTPGLFSKFVADKAGDFTSGKLYVYNQSAEGDYGKWILMNNSNLDEMINLAHNAYAKGATAFIRLEWVTNIGGKIYISETGLDNPYGLTSSVAQGGEIAHHHVERAGDSLSLSANDFSYYDYYGRVLEYDPSTDNISVFLEAGPAFYNQISDSVSSKGGKYPEKHLSNPDGLGKITVNNKDYMLICEDLNGSSHNRVPEQAPSKICELYMLDMSIENPTVDDLTRIMAGPHNAELTGANGTPDGKTILVNVQHPGSQTYPYTSDYAVTVALTGWDYIFNTEKSILSFEFKSPEATGIISGSDISLEVPKGTNVTTLVPTIEISKKASIKPESGIAQDFSKPVTYTVTAEDKSTKDYKVSVTINTETGILNPFAEEVFTVYPNPATRELFFNNTCSVAIYNSEGALIKVKENSDRINISELPAGIYFIKTSTGKIKQVAIQ